jgi:hypothetical protein
VVVVVEIICPAARCDTQTNSPHIKTSATMSLNGQASRNIIEIPPPLKVFCLDESVNR